MVCYHPSNYTLGPGQMVTNANPGGPQGLSGLGLQEQSWHQSPKVGSDGGPGNMASKQELASEG